MATIPKPLPESPDFSLMLGGPLYQMFQRAHLSGPALELLKRRIFFFTALTWLPLFLLAMIGGNLLYSPGVSFFRDFETHARFLIALPMFIVAEMVVHERTQIMLRLFLKRGVVTPDDTPNFYAIIDAALRVRNSVVIEVLLLVFVYTVGHWVWLQRVALNSESWYSITIAGHVHLTLPGYWYSFVSIPVFQFILIRWVMRILIWFWLLWRVSRLNLRLMPTHPDGAGGLGFVGGSTRAFGPLLFAQGAVLAGILASQILYEGHKLYDFRWTIAGDVAFFVLLVFAPLIVFSGHLLRSKRIGLREYGNLATSYVTEFDEKWLRGGAKGEALLGASDIQSLADLANSYSVVRQMRSVPFGFDEVKVMVAVTVAPMLPLLLTIMPLEDLLQRLIKVVL